MHFNLTRQTISEEWLTLALHLHLVWFHD